MKKYKITLLSIAVFMTVFILAITFDFNFPNYKNKHSKINAAKTAEADTLAKVTEAAQIELFSFNASNTPSPRQNILPKDNRTTVPSEKDSGTITTPTPKPVATPTPKPKAKYADVGIAAAKDYVNIRKKASTDSNILGKLYRGSACKILRARGSWYYVESGSVKGYVSSDFIKTKIPDKELIKKYGTLSISVECDGLNVRKKPSTTSKRVTVVYKDEVYPVIKTKGKWLKIKVPDDKTAGYVKCEFTELIVEFKEAVSKKEEALQKKLETEKKARKKAKKAGRTSSDTKRENTNYSYSELQLLSCLIHAEAGSQSYETKLAVANVVLNRMKSSRYPDSMTSVIYQSGQFTVASSGSLKKQLGSYKNFDSSLQQMSIKAAKDALAGSNNIGSRMHFNSYGAAVRKGYDDNSTAVKLGGLLFW